MTSAAIVADLATRVTTLASGKDRVIIAVVGPPGAGKSTLTAQVAQRLHDLAITTAVVPMDGFHLANAELARLGRADRKGAIDTFDGDGYLALLRRLRDPREQVVYAPTYVRGTLEEPIGSAIAVGREVRVVFTEGNYLLVDEPPWSGIPELVDQSWFVNVDPALRQQRLLARHLANGKDPERARAFTFGSDENNAQLVTATSPRADVVIDWP